MCTQIFKNTLLNTPYEYPGRHWELNEKGQPAQTVVEIRFEEMVDETLEENHSGTSGGTQ